MDKLTIGDSLVVKTARQTVIGMVVKMDGNYIVVMDSEHALNYLPRVNIEKVNKW